MHGLAAYSLYVLLTTAVTAQSNPDGSRWQSRGRRVVYNAVMKREPGPTIPRPTDADNKLNTSSIFSNVATAALGAILAANNASLPNGTVLHFDAKEQQRPPKPMGFRYSTLIGDRCGGDDQCPDGAICFHGFYDSGTKYCVCKVGKPSMRKNGSQYCPDALRSSNAKPSTATTHAPPWLKTRFTTAEADKTTTGETSPTTAEEATVSQTEESETSSATTTTHRSSPTKPHRALTTSATTKTTTVTTTTSRNRKLTTTKFTKLATTTLKSTSKATSSTSTTRKTLKSTTVTTTVKPEKGHVTRDFGDAPDEVDYEENDVADNNSTTAEITTTATTAETITETYDDYNNSEELDDTTPTSDRNQETRSSLLTETGRTGNVSETILTSTLTTTASTTAFIVDDDGNDDENVDLAELLSTTDAGEVQLSEVTRTSVEPDYNNNSERDSENQNGNRDFTTTDAIGPGDVPNSGELTSTTTELMDFVETNDYTTAVPLTSEFDQSETTAEIEQPVGTDELETTEVREQSEQTDVEQQPIKANAADSASYCPGNETVNVLRTMIEDFKAVLGRLQITTFVARSPEDARRRKTTQK